MDNTCVSDYAEINERVLFDELIKSHAFTSRKLIIEEISYLGKCNILKQTSKDYYLPNPELFKTVLLDIESTNKSVRGDMEKTA
jgi:hypothetical protein